MAISGHNQNGPFHLSNKFPTTQWGAVLAAGDTASPGADQALEKLCRTYWRPVYDFVRRQGYGPDDALDLTQEFFAGFLEQKVIKLADPQRGKFRSFFLTALKNFLANQRKRCQREKRGGGRQIFSLDEHQDAESCFRCEPADPGASPDQAFERSWSLTLLAQALANLEQEFSASGRREHFEALKSFVWGDHRAVSQTQLAIQLGMTANAVSVNVHRLRNRFGELLRETIAHTVATDAEIDAELRHLIHVIGASG